MCADAGVLWTNLDRLYAPFYPSTHPSIQTRIAKDSRIIVPPPSWSIPAITTPHPSFPQTSSPLFFPTTITLPTYMGPQRTKQARLRGLWGQGKTMCHTFTPSFTAHWQQQQPGIVVVVVVVVLVVVIPRRITSAEHMSMEQGTGERNAQKQVTDWWRVLPSSSPSLFPVLPRRQ